MRGACWDLEYKLSSLRRDGSQDLLGASQRVIAEIMPVLQMVLAFSNRLRDGWEALYGDQWAWHGNLLNSIGSQRGLFTGLQRASINGWRCVVSALLVSGLSRKGSMWPWTTQLQRYCVCLRPCRDDAVTHCRGPCDGVSLFGRTTATR